jgi:hypothetical protein
VPKAISALNQNAQKYSNPKPKILSQGMFLLEIKS